jgi:acetylornithine deacetylase/succinyl-diaminopimelate desuccinylase-like protein
VTVQEYLARNREKGLQELEEFLRIPSISSQPDRAADVRRAAEHLRDRYSAIGLEHATVLATAGHPVVYADWLHAEGKPTVLLYGHYDVQPVDPLEQWHSPPFEPNRNDGLLLARGASDDKGQIALHWQALEALLQVTGRLPLNVKVIAEGEEETGSQNFDRFVEENRERLQTDFCLISDTAVAAKGLPAITYALRGLLYFEIRVETANSDLHSGEYGGVAPNPIQALAEIVTGLKDASGTILVPGFYDGVRPLTEEERRQFARIPTDEAATRRTHGLEALAGEPGFSPIERRWGRPTLDFNGIWGGYQGPGTKTIIPAFAAAKFSCRLVPDQDPAVVSRRIREHLEVIRPRTARVQLQELGTGAPWITPMGHPLLQAARRALEQAYGKEPVFTRSGGSIGAVESMNHHLSATCLLIGFVLPDCHAHAPNESLDLESFEQGRQAAVRLWDAIAAITPLPAR